ncbi:MAG: PaaI family thioesterase [Oscillospiraceae bacterium]|nr:PaaI family thioesterase [Oscillospiraceae bacterium]
MTKDEYLKTAKLDYRCRFTDFCGIDLEEVTDDGTCIFSAMLTDDQRNPFGIAHGGMIGTMMDVCAGTVALIHDVTGRTRLFVTQTADIHYLRPVTDGKIVGIGRLIHAGRKTALAQTDVYDENDKLCATAMYTLFYTED